MPAAWYTGAEKQTIYRTAKNLSYRNGSINLTREAKRETPIDEKIIEAMKTTALLKTGGR
jgi:hypothetical protein